MRPISQQLQALAKNVPVFDGAVTLRCGDTDKTLMPKVVAALPITDHPPLLIETPLGVVATMNIWCPNSAISPSYQEKYLNQSSPTRYANLAENNHKEQMEKMAEYIFDMMKAGAVAVALQEVPNPNSDKKNFDLLSQKLESLVSAHKGTPPQIQFVADAFRQSFQETAGTRSGVAVVANAAFIPSCVKTTENDTLASTKGNRCATYALSNTQGQQLIMDNIHGEYGQDTKTNSYVTQQVAKGHLVVGDLNTRTSLSSIAGTTQNTGMVGDTYDVATFNLLAYQSRLVQMQMPSSTIQPLVAVADGQPTPLLMQKNYDITAIESRRDASGKYLYCTLQTVHGSSNARIYYDNNNQIIRFTNGSGSSELGPNSPLRHEKNIDRLLARFNLQPQPVHGAASLIQLASLQPQSRSNASIINDLLKITSLDKKTDAQGGSYYQVNYWSQNGNPPATARIYLDGRLTNGKGVDLSAESPLRNNLATVLAHFDIKDVEQSSQPSSKMRM